MANFAPNIFPIPVQEPEYNENYTGTDLHPWLYKISEGKNTSASLIFHMKIDKKFYEYVLFRKYKKNDGTWSTRCTKHQQSAYLSGNSNHLTQK